MDNKEYDTFWTPETQQYYKKDNIIKTKDQYLYDDKGNKYLDMNSGTWNVILGYNKEEYNKSIKDINNDVGFIPNVRFSHKEGDRLSKRILSLTDNYYKSVFFTSGGAEAVETAVKFAKQYWYNKGEKSKTRIISLYDSYHGSTICATSLSGDPWDRIAYDPMLINPLKIYPYYCYKCRLGLNNKICNMACLKDLEFQINFYGEENISSIILEPIMGVGGILIPSKEWMNELFRICHEHNILIIFDEVSSGFGRCGNYFALLDYDVRPNIVTFGKCVSNGVAPLGGVMVTKEIYDEFNSSDTDRQFKHGFTNSGHPLSCGVGNITLDIFEKDNIIDKIKEKEKEFSKLLDTIKDKPYIGEIRIKGLMIAIELVDPDNNESLVIPDLLYMFKEKGIIMSQMTQVVNFMPSVCVTTEEFKYALDTLIDIVENYLKTRQN